MLKKLLSVFILLVLCSGFIVIQDVSPTKAAGQFRVTVEPNSIKQGQKVQFTAFDCELAQGNQAAVTFYWIRTYENGQIYNGAKYQSATHFVVNDKNSGLWIATHQESNFEVGWYAIHGKCNNKTDSAPVQLEVKSASTPSTVCRITDYPSSPNPDDNVTVVGVDDSTDTGLTYQLYVTPLGDPIDVKQATKNSEGKIIFTLGKLQKSKTYNLKMTKPNGTAQSQCGDTKTFSVLDGTTTMGWSIVNGVCKQIQGGTYATQVQCNAANGSVNEPVGGSTPTATPLPPTEVPATKTPPGTPCAEGRESNDPNAPIVTSSPDGRNIKVCTAISTALGVIPIDPLGFVNYAFKIILGVAGSSAIFIIIFSGYRFMVSQGNPEKVKEAREALISAIVGLLFILFALVILEVIGVDIFQIPGFGH